MTTRSRRLKSIGSQSTELALAVPQVMAHRLTRMAIAGPTLSARDRKEFNLMIAEKNAAMAEAWTAMATHAWRTNQALALSMMGSLWSPSPWRTNPTSAFAAQLQNAALGILGQGLAPVHRKATANARRLAKTRLR